MQPTGPQVADDEDVYRAILTPMQWSAAQNRPSSAAFDDEVFSVDIVSRTTIAEMRARFREVFHIVRFNCGDARTIDFDTRDEPDPDFPENVAHAHVYSLHATSSNRKKKARKLAEMCRLESE